MSHSTNYPDADFTPNDIGPSRPNAIPLSPEARAEYQEKLQEMEEDELIF